MLVFLMAYTDVSLTGFVSDAVHSIRRKHHVAPPGKVVHTAFELRNQGFHIDRIKIDQLITSDLDLIGAMGVVDVSHLVDAMVLFPFTFFKVGASRCWILLQEQYFI